MNRKGTWLVATVGITAAVLLAAAPVEAGTVRVLFAIPKIEVKPGEIFEVPVAIEDGSEDVLSYSLGVRYNPAVVRIVGIRGGTFEGFGDDPVTDPSRFEVGDVDFTATNASFMSTPEAFNVATVTFEVVGEPGDQTKLLFRKTLRTDIPVRQTFGPARPVQLSGAGKLLRVR